MGCDEVQDVGPCEARDDDDGEIECVKGGVGEGKGLRGGGGGGEKKRHVGVAFVLIDFRH